MATAGNLVVNIIGHTQGLQQETDKARKLIGGFVSFAKSALAGLGLGVGIGASLSKAMELETTIVQFDVLLGSQQRAVKLMEELRGFAAETPFQLGDIADSTKLLLNAGIAAEDMVGTLRMLGDLAAAGGKNIGEVAFVFSQVRTAGRLMGQDLNQLLNANIPAIKALAEEFGVAESEVRGLVSTGAVTFERLESAMKSLTEEGGQLHGMTQRLSQTSQGLWSTLKDNISEASAGLGKYISDTINLNGLLRDAGAAAKWIGENIAMVTKAVLSLAAAYLITSRAAKILTTATQVVMAAMSGGLVPVLQKLGQLLFATLAVFGILSTAESLLADETSEVAREIEQANGALDKHVDAQDRAAEAASATADKVSKEVERFRELIAAIEEVNNFNPRGAGAMDMAEFRHQLEKNILDIDMFLAEMLVKHRPVNPDLAMLQELVAKQGPKLTDDQFNLIDSLTDIVAGDETAKQRASLTREIELAERRIGYLIRDTSEEVQKVNDLSDGSVKNLDLQRELLMRLNREQEMLNEKKRQQQSLDEFNKFQLEEAQRIQRAFAEANDLLKTPADNILDKLIDFQAAGVGGELFQDAAIKLAEATGLFDPKDKEIVNQQALTAVSGMDAISAVNQFNRDMERQKAEAEKQAKRDEKASKERERIIKALEGVGVNTKPLKDLKLAGAVP